MDPKPLTQEQFAEFVKRMDQRFDSVDGRLNDLREEVKILDGKMDGRITSLEGKVETRINRIDSRLWRSAATLILLAIGAVAKLTFFK